MALPLPSYAINLSTLASLSSINENGGWSVGLGSTAYHSGTSGTTLSLPSAQGGGNFYPLGYRYSTTDYISGLSIVEASLYISDGVGMGMSMDSNQGVYFGIFKSPDNTGYYCKMWFGYSKDSIYRADQTRGLPSNELILSSKFIEGSAYNFRMIGCKRGWIVLAQNAAATGGNVNFREIIDLPMKKYFKNDDQALAIRASGVHGVWATNGYSSGTTGKIGNLKVYTNPRLGYPYVDTTVFSDNFDRVASSYNPSSASTSLSNVAPNKWSFKGTTNASVYPNGSYLYLGTTTPQKILDGYTENPVTFDGCGGPDGTGTYISYLHNSSPTWGSIVRIDYSTGFDSVGNPAEYYTTIDCNNTTYPDKVYVTSIGRDTKNVPQPQTMIGSLSLSTYPYIKLAIEFYDSRTSTDLILIDGYVPTITTANGEYQKKVILYQSSDGATWIQSAGLDGLTNNAQELIFTTIEVYTNSRGTGFIDNMKIVKFPSYSANWAGYPMSSNYDLNNVWTNVQTGTNTSVASPCLGQIYRGSDKVYTVTEAG